MSKKILIVTATEAEASAFKRIPEIKFNGDSFLLGNCELSVLITGVGSVATAWGMAKWLSANQKPDLAINIGIAGSFSEELQIGDVVVPVEDCFADAGIEDGSRFLTLAEAGLTDPDKFPFKSNRIEADNYFVGEAIKIMKPVKAITVNTASGLQQTIDRLIKKYNPDIETMEGATFFYICSGEKIPFLALRSTSNKVEPRNKDNWNIPLALENLSEKMKRFLLSLN